MQEAMCQLHQQLHPQLHHQLLLLRLLQAPQERHLLQLLPAQLEALLQLLQQLHPLEVEEQAQQLLLLQQQVQLSDICGHVAQLAGLTQFAELDAESFMNLQEGLILLVSMQTVDLHIGCKYTSAHKHIMLPQCVSSSAYILLTSLATTWPHYVHQQKALTVFA